jgi:hypothetical protein
MKRLMRAVLPTLLMGLALPAIAGDAGSRQQSTAQAQEQAYQQQLPSDSKNAQTGQNDAKKHPPTAVMDRATPAEKSRDDAATKGKHPPTSVMERATPDMKSPDSSSDTQSQSSTESSASAKSQ